MVRPVSAKHTAGWKAVLAIVVAGGALLWHLLACTESPMAFSPEGDLAFVTVQPWMEEQDDASIAGACVYQLMVISKAMDLRVLEQTTTHMLTGPAWSPDAKHIAYLRIPLLTPGDTERLEAAWKERKQQLKQATARPPDEKWSSVPRRQTATVPATRPSRSDEELALPPFQPIADLVHNAAAAPLIPAELVTRNVETGKVVSVVKVELPLAAKNGEDIGGNLKWTYFLTRPQYGADGKWVYFCFQNVVMAVNPTTADKRFLAAPAMQSQLSPDGKTVAFLQEKVIGFLRTDGQKAVYLRWDQEPSLWGLIWADDKTLAILRNADKENEDADLALDYVASDGSSITSQPLPLGDIGRDAQTAQLGIAPDAKHMVISVGEKVFFMKGDGTILKAWTSEKEALVQPTFTPDSKRVAFKSFGRLEEQDEGGPIAVRAVVFFTPQGEEISRVAVPLVSPPQTRPATCPARQPATQPSTEFHDAF